MRNLNIIPIRFQFYFNNNLLYNVKNELMIKIAKLLRVNQGLPRILKTQVGLFANIPYLIKMRLAIRLLEKNCAQKIIKFF